MQLRSPILAPAVLAAIAFSACKPDASDRAIRALEWTNKFYTDYDLRGAWYFFGAEAHGENVKVFINIPDLQATQIMVMPDEDQAQFIARIACPPAGETVWSMLDFNGDLIINARHNGNVFSQISCKTKKKGTYS